MAKLVDDNPEPEESGGTGETTSILEEAVRLIGTLPEDQYVFVTGPHTRWLFELEREFKATGLVGIKFLTVDAILNRGALRGYRGVLLVDDIIDLPTSAVDRLFVEAEILERSRPLMSMRLE